MKYFDSSIYITKNVGPKWIVSFFVKLMFIRFSNGSFSTSNRLKLLHFVLLLITFVMNSDHWSHHNVWISQTQSIVLRCAEWSFKCNVFFRLILQKTATAVAYCKRGCGLIRVNGRPLDQIEPKVLQYKLQEPILLLGKVSSADFRFSKIFVSTIPPLVMIYETYPEIDRCNEMNFYFWIWSKWNKESLRTFFSSL